MSSATDKRLAAPENHRAPWTEIASAELQSLFEQGLELDAIAEKSGRTRHAVCGQLERLKLLVNFGGIYYRMDPAPWVDLRAISQPKKGKGA